jgi:23S rRNA-/tRNA-specific pseudouridylate synthase
MARELSQQFQQRTVEKTYLALVRGGAKSFPSTASQIRSPIQYVNGRASLDSSDLGKPSSTDWELICSSVSFSLLDAVTFRSETQFSELPHFHSFV